MSSPDLSTVGLSLYWSYANLAMAHAAVSQQATKYQRTHFIIRSRLFNGLKLGKMDVGSIVEDERLKMILPQACSYCGIRQHLSVDHLIAKNRGGQESGDNIVWACRACNSAKGDTDLLEWLAKREVFPPLLLLRRYLKLAITYAREANMMDKSIEGMDETPFSLAFIPQSFPQPEGLRLWIVNLGE